jgi:hypothetical protein
MDDVLIERIWRRAKNACEYCLLPQSTFPIPFEIDHIIARQHDGPTIFSNLALSCPHCNQHKGTNLTGIDPRSRKIVVLYNPRRNKWARHFRWSKERVIGRTAIGRATVQVLAMNDDAVLKLRRALIEAGLFP